jgi:transcriptional regulator with XRE-family HTH domain
VITSKSEGRRTRGSGGLYQRGNDGLWVATVDLGILDGKRVRKTVSSKSKREVQKKFTRLKNELRVMLSIPENTSKRFSPEETHKWIGERLDFLGLNQEQFSKKAGIAESEVSRYRSRKARPRIEFLERLAIALDIDLVSLLIALGAVEFDTKSTPQIIKGQLNKDVIWEVAKQNNLLRVDSPGVTSGAKTCKSNLPKRQQTNLYSNTNYDDIETLGRLLGKGYLTQREFDLKKQQILDL